MAGNKLHSSWIIAWISFGVLAGIGLSTQIDRSFLNISWLVIAFSFFFIVFINRTKKIIFLAVVAGVILGLFRAGLVLESRTIYDQYIGKNVVLQGEVADDTTLSVSGGQKIILKNIVIDDKPLDGSVWVSTPNQALIRRSDIVVVEGVLNKGFGNFPASIYRAQVIKTVSIKNKDPARELRDWFAGGIRNVIHDPEASLGIGFLTGQHTALPEDLNNNLRILGLTHIVVASGYNLTILVRFCRRFFMRISKYFATMVSGFLIAGFVLITGFSPSMNRAALITGLSLTAWYYGRRIHPVVLLSFSAAITALINPGYVWGDLGWYLSFAAFAGVIILAPLIYDYFWDNSRSPGALHQVFLETLSAQILTAPIIAYAFNMVAPLSLPANLLILIFIPLAMVLTFIAGVAGVVSLPLGLIALPALAVLSYMTVMVDKLALLPVAVTEVNFRLQALLVSYLAVFLFTVFLWRRTRHDYLKSSVVE